MAQVEVPLPDAAALRVQLALIERAEAETRLAFAEQHLQFVLTALLQVLAPQLPLPASAVQFDPTTRRLSYEAAGGGGVAETPMRN
jgi:hypothetical protein